MRVTPDGPRPRSRQRRTRLERQPRRHHGRSGRQHLFHREQPGPIGRIDLTTFVITESSPIGGRPIRTASPRSRRSALVRRGHGRQDRPRHDRPDVTNEFPVSGDNLRDITAGLTGTSGSPRARFRCDRPHHHIRRRQQLRDDSRSANGNHHRARTATSGSPPVGVRVRSAGSQRLGDHAVRKRPDHPLRWTSWQAPTAICTSPKTRCRAVRADHDARRDHRVLYRSDLRLRAMGHRKRLGRQHLVHRERGESGRATHLRTRRHHRSGHADFAGTLPVAGHANARSKRRAVPPTGDAPRARQVGDHRRDVRRDPRAAPRIRRSTSRSRPPRRCPSGRPSTPRAAPSS